MPRPKGEVWKYFQELPENKNGSLVQCLKCEVRITRGSAEASRGGGRDLKARSETVGTVEDRYCTLLF
jgi:hypothetical protein